MKTAGFEVRAEDREVLESWLRSKTTAQALGMRARVVERWFGIISQQAIGRGGFTSVVQLERAITRFLAHWNQGAKPFVWTKAAAQIKRSIRNARLISVM
jgi:hypothetical protein